MFDRVSMLIGSGVITAGVAAAMLASAGVAIAATEPGADSSPSTSDASGRDNGGIRADQADTDTDTQDRNQDAGAAESFGDTGSGEPTDAKAETETDDPDTAADTDAEAEANAAADDAEAEINAAAEADPEVAEADTPPEAATETDTATEADAEEVGALAGSEDPDTDDADHTDLTVGGGDAAIASSRPTDAVTETLDTTTAPVTEGPDDGEPDAEPEHSAEPERSLGQPAGPVGVADVWAAAAQTRTESAEVAEPTPAVEPLAMLSAAEAPSAQATAPRQTLLSIAGTIVFNLYGFAIRLFGGPPLLPSGSTVAVHSSKLEIDCGDGYEVPADWYLPEGPTPTQLIYLQHGFMAAGPFYSYTASRLAEATHSIVVAPSLTSNFLACDGCWVGGSQMHQGVADLFVDGNTALADSATAAGYSPSLLDGVEKVVLMGHSAGGGLAAGAGGYMVDNGTVDRLAGVVMLDGVGFGQVMPDALAKLPDEVAIYNLAGKAYFWNMNGATGAALEQERPGEFNGVRLIGGLHSDTMAGGNPLVQIGLYLVTGFSTIENVKAAEILSAAWINDMYAGSRTSPYYGAAGTILDIDTPRGTAEAIVMPGPPERLTVIDVVFGFLANMLFSLNFATCAAPSAGASAQQAGDLIELSTPNTALSLDGTAKRGHAIGQRVCAA